MTQGDPTSAGPTVTIRVRAFARYAELLGADVIDVEVTAPTRVNDVVAALRAQAPDGHLIPEHPMVSVNLEHIHADQAVGETDEIAILPPLAGG